MSEPDKLALGNWIDKGVGTGQTPARYSATRLRPKPAGYAPVWGRSQAVCLPAEAVQEPSAPAAHTVESDDLRSSSTRWLGPGGLQLVIVIAPNHTSMVLQGKTGRGNMWLGGLPLLTDEPGVHQGPVLTATLLGIIMDETLDASLDRIAAVRAIEPEQVRRRPGGDEIFDWCQRQQEGAPVQAAGSVALEGQVYLACGVQYCPMKGTPGQSANGSSRTQSLFSEGALRRHLIPRRPWSMTASSAAHVEAVLPASDIVLLEHLMNS